MAFPALALVLLMMVPSSEAVHTRLLNGGDVQMGIKVHWNYQGHHDAPPSLGSGTTWALLRYSPTGSMGAAYEGVARNTADENIQKAWLSWGAGGIGPLGASAGGCKQTDYVFALTCTEQAGNVNGLTTYTPNTPVVTECSSYRHSVGAGAWGTGPPPNSKTSGQMLVRHDYCPVEDKANVYRNNVTFVNQFVDTTIPDLQYRRAMEWNTETTPTNMGAPQYVSIGGTTPPPPALVGFGDDGRASFSPNTPFAAPVCASPGVYFDNCTTGKGFVFDLRLGAALPPLSETTICIYYGGAPSYAAALAELRDLNVELYSIAYRGDDSPATFFFGIGCLSGPIVDFTWAAESHIHAPSGWTPLTPCVGSKVAFSDLSYLNGLVKGAPTKSQWRFGDGDGASTSWNDEVTHTYTAPGPYDVTLTVWGPDERNTTLTKTIEVIECLPPPPVNEAPVLMAVPCRTVTEGSIVRFTPTVYDPDVPPDPAQFYTLSFSLEGAPPGAQFLGNVFHWEASVLGEHRFTLRVQDNGAPPLSDETQLCITVYPQPPAPESSDADGDGVPDAHDPCPATAGATGCPKDGSHPPPPAEGSTGQGGSGGGCDILDLVPRDVEARSGDDHVTITWRAPPDCFIDRFLVWNGTQGDLIASVPFDPEIDLYEAVDPDPWNQPHRYYVQAEGGPGVDVFVYPRAVATEPVVFLACMDCDAGPPAGPASDDVPPIGGISSVFVGIPSQLMMPGLPIVLLLLLAWWLWHSYGVLVRVFSRIDDEKALEHPTRALLHGIVAAEPGIHERDAARLSSRSRGVVRHHLKILVAAGLLEKRSEKGFTRYFVRQTASDEMQTAGTLRGGLARTLLARIQDRPGQNVTQLAESLGVTRKAIRYHIRRLEQGGLVQVERTGEATLVRPREDVVGRA